jgi:hypothetical protein
MKKLTFTTAIFMAATTTAALAHHPAVDMVDADTYAMISENVADTPHVDLVLDDMGSAMDQAAGDQGAQDMARAGEIVNLDVAMDTADTMDTMDLMEDVEALMAQ